MNQTYLQKIKMCYRETMHLFSHSKAFAYLHPYNVHRQVFYNVRMQKPIIKLVMQNTLSDRKSRTILMLLQITTENT